MTYPWAKRSPICSLIAIQDGNAFSKSTVSLLLLPGLRSGPFLWRLCHAEGLINLISVLQLCCYQSILLNQAHSTLSNELGDSLSQQSQYFADFGEVGSVLESALADAQHQKNT